MNNSGANKPKLKSLKCTQCGGTISVRGGHNVRTIVCEYCGACLDSKKEFAVLHRFINQKRPFLPLKIGARGKLKGVEFTVIGVLQYEQREDGEIYRWLEYLMFSYTHGYVYLCYEDGHWVLMHEVKDLPETSVEIVMPLKSKFEVRGHSFKVFECASAKLSFVEGELTWQARQNETIRYLDAICPPYLYSIESRAAEIEYFWGEYLSHAEVSEAFKIECIKPSSVFSCQPFSCSPTYKSLAHGAMIASVIALLMYFMVTSSGTYVSGHTLGDAVFKDSDTTNEFVIDSPGALYSANVRVSGLNNSWAFLELRIINAAETEEFCAMPAEVSYYHGVEGGESWSEGSRDETLYFRVPEAGSYKIDIEGEGNRGETSVPDPNFSPGGVRVEIRKGVRLGHHTLAWFFISLLLAAPYFVRVYRFERTRWHEDEDDD